MSLADFLTAFRGRCITFVGDSVSREMHFALLLWAYDCDRPAHARDARFVHQGINATERCAFFLANIKSRATRVTAVPAGTDPQADIIVRFIFTRYMDELNRESVVTEMMDRDACDLFIFNVGFWHVRIPRSPADIDNVAAQAQSFLRSLGWRRSAARRAFIRGHAVWRSSTLIELADKLFENRQLQKLNQRVDGLLRSFGVRVYNYEDMFEGASDSPRLRIFTKVG